MSHWAQLAEDEALGRAVMALRAKGYEVFVVEDGDTAARVVFDLIPEGAEVMTMTSMTLQALGINQVIDKSGRYDSVRKKLKSMNRKTEGQEMNRLGAAPEWAIGSVHAVTEGGSVLVASYTGSQLPAYAYGARRVIWVVGTQKIVKDVSEGMQRIWEYCLPLEDERAREAYGVGSAVNKLLIIHGEVRPNRITVIFVKAVLGF
jgi:hypothetical protein